MTTSRAKTLIARVAEREDRAVKAVVWPSTSMRADRVTQRRVLRSLFRAEVNGFRSLARWVSAPPGIPSARLLLRHQPLLVDIRPMGRELFVETHGMTPWDMATFVEHGLIIVNLHEYEADRTRDFDEHQAHVDVLLPLLRQRVGCRIMYVRRDRYFDLLGDGVRERREEAETKARKCFEKALPCLESDPDLLFRLTGFRTATDAAQKVAENWSYLEVLATSCDELSAWIEATRPILDAGPKPEVIEGKLRDLNAWKHEHASPQVRAFGGTLLLVPEDIEATLPGAPPSDVGHDSRDNQAVWTPLRAEHLLAASRELSPFRLEMELLVERLHTSPRVPDLRELKRLRQTREMLAGAERRVLSRFGVHAEDLADLQVLRLGSSGTTHVVTLRDSGPDINVKEIAALPMKTARAVGPPAKILSLMSRLPAQRIGGGAEE